MRNDDQAQGMPIAIVILLVVGIAWQFLYYDDSLPTFDPDNDTIGDPQNETEQGGLFDFLSVDAFDSIAALLATIWDAAVLFMQLLTFSLADGPDTGVFSLIWTAFTWSWRVVISGSFLWAIASLIRG
jgi:hypothetical protein